MRRLTLVPVAAFLIVTGASAQSEGALKAAFEGKTVYLRIEMPGSDDGVDLHPGTPNAIDFSQHTGRLKKFGVAYRPGDAAQVTKVRVKGDHIEFQLGAGGFGTAGDNASTTVDARAAPKSQREKDLEASLKTVKDPRQKREMSDGLDRLRTTRQREDARNATRAEEAQAIKESTVRQKRLESGSRFNLRYDHSVPAAALTPAAVMAALADYVDFAVPALAAAQSNELRKGMTVDEVDAALGRPESITQRSEGTLKVSTSIYRTRTSKVTAEFVEGVLIRFRSESL